MSPGLDRGDRGALMRQPASRLEDGDVGAPYMQHRSRLRRLQQAHDDDHQRLEQIVGFGRDADVGDGPGEGRDQHRPDQGAGQREATAGQRRTADDHGQDGVELDPQPSVVGVHRVVLAAMIRPAMPAHSADEDVDGPDDRAERTPASRLASGLMPTDSMSRPSAVRRMTNAATAKTPSAIGSPTGRRAGNPGPSAAKARC